MTVDDRSVPVMLGSRAGAVRDPQDLLGPDGAQCRRRPVPLAQFVRFEHGAIAAQLDRHGQRRAVEMDIALAEGLPLRSAVDELRALAARTLPADTGLLLLRRRGDAGGDLARRGDHLRDRAAASSSWCWWRSSRA